MAKKMCSKKRRQVEIRLPDLDAIIREDKKDKIDRIMEVIDDASLTTFNTRTEKARVMKLWRRRIGRIL